MPVQIPAQPETEQIPIPMDVGAAEGSASGDKGKEKESVNDITSGPGVWWIRANQGHTIKVTPPNFIFFKFISNGHHPTLKVEDLELTPINDPAEVPIAIHGTHISAWNKIGETPDSFTCYLKLNSWLLAKKGLSVMGRNHIHIAVGRPGASGVLSGEHPSCTLMDITRISNQTFSGWSNLWLVCRYASEIRYSHPH